MDAARTMIDVVDPLLMGHGFSPAQFGGVLTGSDQIIWCAAYTDLQAHHPEFPQARDQEDRRDHACVDLVIDLEDFRIVRLDLETLSLADTFTALGDEDSAQRAASLLGQSCADAAPTLAELLGDLFRADR